MPRNDGCSLWSSLSDASGPSSRWLWGQRKAVRLSALTAGTCLDRPLGDLDRRSVLLLTSDPLAAATALIELDGIARRVVLAPPDLALAHLPHVIATAEIENIVSDREDVVSCAPDDVSVTHCLTEIAERGQTRPREGPTDWVLFTSGTTGIPKLVLHDLSSLAGAIRPGADLSRPAVWATFYDIRRFGGLQIFLRALLGGGSLVFPSPEEPIGEFLDRAGVQGATHVTGTPSHWRRARMSTSLHRVDPEYVRLSGEIADQTILDGLRVAFPRARVAHAFATTEAGLAFEVNDGLAGFPAEFCERSSPGEVEMRVVDDTLRVRSQRTAKCYLGEHAEPLLDGSGFVDTGDLLERKGDRYFFAGRRGGIINVGGLKVHPEEVEAVINRHPRVQMSRVKARRNPITGALVVAEVVLVDVPRTAEFAGYSGASSDEVIKESILVECRRSLAAHKVPAVVRFVPTLPLTSAGKVARGDA